MMAVNPKTGKKQYFVDKCLPFGASISCAQFQKFSDALQFLAEYRIKINFGIRNYLDDFLFVAWLKIQCDQRMSEFLELCKEIGWPIALEKTEWGTTIIIFLGVLLDGKNKCICIPEDKRCRATNQLLEICENKKTTVMKLLNFLCKCVVLGRVFLRRLYAQIPSKFYKLQQNKKLKPYQHVYLNREFREDCKVWLIFLKEAEMNKRLLC